MNQNSNCTQCKNPNPTEVYKHLPGYVKLLCSINDLISTVTGTGSYVKSVSPTIDDLQITKSSVTQLTSATTPVTVNTSAGTITTVSQTLASNGIVNFTVNNSKAKSNSAIFLSLDESLNTTGQPVVRVQTKADGSFVVSIHNHGGSALNNILKIDFLIV